MMNIGKASTASGASAKMIRYYESIGLIPPAQRTESGYRFYTDDNVHVLRFIRRARDLGFSVEDIAGLLALWQDRHRASGDVKRIAMGHVAALRRKIDELQGMVDTLQSLAAHCHGDDRPDCPILADLDGPADEVAHRSREAHKSRFGRH